MTTRALVDGEGAGFDGPGCIVLSAPELLTAHVDGPGLEGLAWSVRCADQHHRRDRRETYDDHENRHSDPPLHRITRRSGFDGNHSFGDRQFQSSTRYSPGRSRDMSSPMHLSYALGRIEIQTPQPTRPSSASTTMRAIICVLPPIGRGETPSGGSRPRGGVRPILGRTRRSVTQSRRGIEARTA